MIYDDHDGWYTSPMKNTYKYIGRADLLVGRHQIIQKAERTTGQGFWNGIQRERVKQLGSRSGKQG